MPPHRRHPDPTGLRHEATRPAPSLGYPTARDQRWVDNDPHDRTPFTIWLTIAALIGILGIVIYLLFFRSAPGERLKPQLPLQSAPETTIQPAVPSAGIAIEEGSLLRSPNSPSGSVPVAGAIPPDSVGKPSAAETQGAAVAELGTTTTSAQRAPSRPRASPSELTELLFQGDKALSFGDVAVARGYYEAAFDAGSPAAATRLGRTYDPLFLSERATLGLQPDSTLAMDWYRKGEQAGDPGARDLLNALLFWLHERSRQKELEAQRTSGDPKY